MGLFGRRKDRRAERKAEVDSLVEWVTSRRGVEIFVEPKTSVTDVSMLLVAHDGEFTRRLVASPQAAQEFARRHQLPIYDATMIGYPQRMRDYSRKQKLLAERAARDRLG